MQAYIDPNQVAIVEVVNHRETNQNYIEALADSMRDVGFSAEYPVDVFRSENIPNHKLDPEATPYVVACGVHRTFAAQKAKLDKIFANIHDGGEEAWVEMMHSDNFQFDPATNRDIGQPFTPKERRAACTQLLLLPKYMEQTNTALAELWNTGESNIRRWKQEVDNLVNLNTNAAQLRVWGISDGRIERLKTVLASNKRTNGKGETVQVRKPRQDASDGEKNDFFEKIRKDLYEQRDDEFNEVIDFDWDAVKRYCCEKWKIKESYGMYRDLHIDQLRELHQVLLEADADFIERCTAIHAAAEELSRLKAQLEKACKKTIRVFKKLVDADNEYDQKFKSKFSVFEGIVKSQLKIKMFSVSRWDYDFCETVRQYEVVIGNHETVQEAIEKEAGWIAEFMQKEAAAAAQKRKEVSKLWTAKRQAAIDAINAYPRDVSFDRIISTAEKELYKSNGYFNKIFDAESVSDKKNIGTLEDEAKSLSRLEAAVVHDDKWVAEIPGEQKPEPVDTSDLENFEIAHIYIEVTGKNGEVFYPEGAEFVEGSKWDYDEEGNLKSKGLNLDAGAIACLSDATKMDLLTICRYNKFTHFTNHFDIEDAREETPNGEREAAD